MAVFWYACNFADGGLDMVPGSGGTPASVSSPAPPNATYAIELQAGDNFNFQRMDLNKYEPTSTPASPFKVTFKIRFTDVTPAAAFGFFVMQKGGGVTNIALRLNTDGSVDILSNDASTVDATISSPFTANTWHDVSLWYEESATGDAEVVIDGVETTTSSKDYDGTGGTAPGDIAIWNNDAGTGTTMYVTEVTLWSDCTNNNDVANHHDVYDWRPGGTPTAKTGSDALDAGSWAGTGEQPLSTTLLAAYTADAQRDGAADYDSTGGGPASDASTPTGTYAGGTWWFWRSRGNGSATTQEILWGSSGDGLGAMQVTADSPAGWRASIVSSTSTTIMPTSSEDAAGGMNNNGARDGRIGEQYYMLAVVASFTATGAQTLPAITQAGSGEQPHESTGTQTLGAVTQAGSGEQPHEGTGTQTLGAVTQAGVGEQPHEGTGAQTLPATTQAGVGVQTMTGTGAQTLGAVTQAGAGEQPHEGTGTQTLGSVTQAGTGEQPHEGTGTQTLASLVQAATGLQTIPGTGAQTLGAVTQAGVGLLVPSGTGTQVLPSFIQTGEGEHVEAAAEPEAPKQPGRKIDHRPYKIRYYWQYWREEREREAAEALARALEEERQAVEAEYADTEDVASREQLEAIREAARLATQAVLDREAAEALVRHMAEQERLERERGERLAILQAAERHRRLNQQRRAAIAVMLMADEAM